MIPQEQLSRSSQKIKKNRKRILEPHHNGSEIETYKYLLGVAEEMMIHSDLPIQISQKYFDLKQITLQKIEGYIEDQSLQEIRQTQSELDAEFHKQEKNFNFPKQLEMSDYENKQKTICSINTEEQQQNHHITYDLIQDGQELHSPSFTAPLTQGLQQTDSIRNIQQQFQLCLNCQQELAQSEQQIQQSQNNNNTQQKIEYLCKFFSEIIDVVFGQYIQATEKIKQLLKQQEQLNNTNNNNLNLLNNFNSTKNGFHQNHSDGEQQYFPTYSDAIDQNTVKFIKKPLEIEIQELGDSLQQLQMIVSKEEINLEKFLKGHVGNLEMCEMLVDKVLGKLEEKILFQNKKINEFTTRMYLLDTNELDLRHQLDALKIKVQEEENNKENGKHTGSFTIYQPYQKQQQQQQNRSLQKLQVQQEEMQIKDMQSKLQNIESNYLKQLKEKERDYKKQIQEKQNKVDILELYYQEIKTLFQICGEKFQEPYGEFLQIKNNNNNSITASNNQHKIQMGQFSLLELQFVQFLLERFEEDNIWLCEKLNEIDSQQGGTIINTNSSNIYSIQQQQQQQDQQFKFTQEVEETYKQLKQELSASKVNKQEQ